MITMEKFKFTFFHLLIITIIACKSEGASAIADLSPQTYYFDAIAGNDNNDGLSPELPFESLDKLNDIQLKSGDRILLANGSTFIGHIPVLGFFGEAGLEITNYKPPSSSSQVRPRIDASGYVSGIYIENSSNISISNLSITADGGEVLKTYGADTVGMRCGILVHIKSDRVFKKINIENIEIESVYYENKGFSRGKDEVTTSNGTESYGWGIRFINTSKSGYTPPVAKQRLP